MKQLTSLDQQFLAVESATHTGHVGGLYLLDSTGGAPVTLAALRELVAARLHLLAPLRRRLLEVPLRFDRPYWVDDDAVDLTAHVRGHVVAAPGGREDLAALVAALHAPALDRARPLWELHLIDGLADGRQAVFGKVHHAVVDGVSAAALLGALLDRTPDAPPAAADAIVPRSGLVPRRRHLVGRGLANAIAHPARSLKAMPRLLPHLDKLPGVERVPGTRAVASLAARVPGWHSGQAEEPPQRRPRVPPTPFNAPISPLRAVAFGSVPVAEVRALRSAFGCSDNDVVLELCASLLRRWLTLHDALPARPLVVGVPVSLRAPRGAEAGNRAGGNAISLMVAPLPTHRADPADRIAAISAAMLVAKRRLKGMPDTWLSDLTDLLPPALMGVTARSLGRVLHAGGRHPVNLVISHVPGPHVPLYLAGARMVAHYPVSAVSDALGGLNITVVGHDGDLDFGFVACPKLVPDLADLAAGLPLALDELHAAASAATAAKTTVSEAGT
ncbi:MAG: wax ester/triacylglycerol synthase family O-acyltransferase [Sporichthyaceae bacterium]